MTEAVQQLPDTPINRDTYPVCAFTLRCKPICHRYIPQYNYYDVLAVSLLAVTTSKVDAGTTKVFVTVNCYIGIITSLEFRLVVFLIQSF